MRRTKCVRRNDERRDNAVDGLSQRPHREAGFTLIELLIAVLLAAMLLASLYGAFFSILGARERADEVIVQSREMRRFIDLFTMEIEAAYFTKDDANTLFSANVKTNGAGGKETGLEFTCFSYPLIVGNRPTGDLKRVRYYFKPGDEKTDDNALGTGILYKEASDRISANAPSAYLVEAIRGLDEVKFSYFDGATWQTEWDAPGAGFLPLAIKVELVFKGQNAALYSVVASPRIR